MKAILIILVILGVLPLPMAVKNSKVPSNLGVKNGKLADMPKSPNAVSSQTEDPGKKVDPFPFLGGLESSREGIKRALQAYGRIEILTEEKDYIHAVSTTGRMKFRDDLEFYFNEKEGVIHFRSASRVGYSDMGLNRKRYDRLMEIYTKQEI